MATGGIWAGSDTGSNRLSTPSIRPQERSHSIAGGGFEIGVGGAFTHVHGGGEISVDQCQALAFVLTLLTIGGSNREAVGAPAE